MDLDVMVGNILVNTRAFLNQWDHILFDSLDCSEIFSGLLLYFMKSSTQDGGTLAIIWLIRTIKIVGLEKVLEIDHH